jgi:hypothetical protein
MLGNSGERYSKYGTFYDSPVLLTLVLSTSARRQSAEENPYFFRLSFGTLWTPVVQTIFEAFMTMKIHVHDAE